ncbi:Ubiquitin-conjugating enzyme E2 1 [Rhizina undulata]
MATRRRILKELEDMAKDTSSGMEASPIDSSNITHLEGRFKGPPGTPYEGGEYIIDIELPDNYPFLPPKMKFVTKVWHPNVSSQTGAICLDTLAAKWSPVLTIKTALLSLQSLLDAPEPNDPQDAEVANMMLKNRPEFDRKAREWARRHAGAPSPTSTSSGGFASLGTQVRNTDYGGYDESVVNNFTNMGFQVSRVIGAFDIVGLKRGQNPSVEQAQRVVELLLG